MPNESLSLRNIMSVRRRCVANGGGVIGHRASVLFHKHCVILLVVKTFTNPTAKRVQLTPIYLSVKIFPDAKIEKRLRAFWIYLQYIRTRSSGALWAPTSSLQALQASFGPSGPWGLLLALWIFLNFGFLDVLEC